jgi:Spy/CpxP family protein refolding chaperone
MRRLLASLLLFFCGFASAQHAHQPYAGQQQRDIKALSSDEVAGYLAGAGMGFAKPAELNGYPGPMHVLELADKLQLSEAQRAGVRGLMDAHKKEARTLGAKLVQSERDLEMLFRHGNVDQERLAATVEQAAKLQGEYRLSHLETHRQALALLTPQQAAAYVQLRGYATEEHRHR